LVEFCLLYHSHKGQERGMGYVRASIVGRDARRAR
jgi:hypothetical protein